MKGKWKDGTAWVGGKLANSNILCWFKTDGLLWFRIFGYGLHFKDVRKHPLLFSERFGFRKRLRIGNFAIGTLKP